jgi:CheY-like chemotaxis protein
MKKVLSVGQCGPDHSGIVAFFERNFGDVAVDTAKLPADTMAKLAGATYDLVLVNRKLDEDYSDGLEIIKAIKADPALQATPVMLITNYADHQDTAVAAGALRGFGKLEFNQPETVDRVRAVLGS